MKYFIQNKIYQFESLSNEKYEEIKSNTIYKLNIKNTNFSINSKLNENVQKSLKWFIDPNNPVYNMTNEKIKSIRLYLQEKVNWEKILRRIFLFVYKSVSKNTNLSEVNFIEEIEKLRNSIEKLEDIKNLMDNFSDLNTSVIYSLIKKQNI